MPNKKLRPLRLNEDALAKAIAESYVLFAKCGVTNREVRLTTFGSIEIYKDGNLVGSYTKVSLAIKGFNELID